MVNVEVILIIDDSSGFESFFKALCKSQAIIFMLMATVQVSLRHGHMRM